VIELIEVKKNNYGKPCSNYLIRI